MPEPTTTKKARGTVVIMAERCNQYNAKGYHPPVLSRKEDCTGCDICGMVCPDFAIYGFIKKNPKGN
jgi:NAD-dependent dihydropyrimidine dehydrogenase PreA subunit